MTACDVLPLCFVGGKGFPKLMHYIEPEYAVTYRLSHTMITWYLSWPLMLSEILSDIMRLCERNELQTALKQEAYPDSLSLFLYSPCLLCSCVVSVCLFFPYEDFLCRNERIISMRLIKLKWNCWDVNEKQSTLSAGWVDHSWGWSVWASGR